MIISYNCPCLTSTMWYYVVHIVWIVRVRMRVITTSNTRISLSLARSLARRRSCYYYDPWLYSVLMWWIPWYMFDENTRIRDTYRSTSTNECDWDNKKSMHSITNYTIDIYPARAHLMYSVSRPKNERSIDGQSRGSWGVIFTWF